MAPYCPSVVQLVGVKRMDVIKRKKTNKNFSIFICKNQVCSLHPNSFPQSSKAKIPTSNFKEHNDTEYAKGGVSPLPCAPSLSSLQTPRSRGRAAVLPEGCGEGRGVAVSPLWGHGDSPAKRRLFYRGEKRDEERFPKSQASRFCQAD